MIRSISPSPRCRLHAKISMAKNNLMSAAAYESDAAIFEQNKRAQMPEVGKIFVAYVQRCKAG